MTFWKNLKSAHRNAVSLQDLKLGERFLLLTLWLVGGFIFTAPVIFVVLFDSPSWFVLVIPTTLFLILFYVEYAIDLYNSFKIQNDENS